MIELLTLTVLVVGFGGGYLWGEFIAYAQRREDRKRRCPRCGSHY